MDSCCNANLVVRSLDVQVSPADVVDGFVVDHEGAVGVLEGRVGCQHGVVRLHDSSRDLFKRDLKEWILLCVLVA